MDTILGAWASGLRTWGGAWGFRIPEPELKQPLQGDALKLGHTVGTVAGVSGAV